MNNIKFDKLKMQTPNISNENIKKLKELFPQIISEDKIDFDILRQLLSENIVEADEERYRLDWVGKKRSLLKANTPINKTLRPCIDESVDFENTKNLYIEGDNFEVLKLLQESYLNKIKMIYIDPPYNTGKDSFPYPDDYSKSRSDFEDEIGLRDEEGNKLFKNTDKNGRFHSDWLSMMYERLLIARDLLKDDGVIFISIDDNEVHNLRKICDEVFGEGNFVNQFIWLNNSAGRQIQGCGGATTKEYILSYSKNIIKIDEFLINSNYAKQIMPDIYKGFNFEIKEDIYGKYITTHELNNGNSAFNEISRPNLVFDIFYNPDTKEVRTGNVDSNIPNQFVRISPKQISNEINKFYAWRWSRDKVEKEFYDLEFIESKDIFKIFTKRRDFKETVLKDVITNLTTIKGTNDLTNLGFNKIFDYPKPIDLIQILLNPIIKGNDLILDFFSGSSTTAHAVMKLNSEDGGNRKFIMVQIPELTDEKSEAFKAGYKNICEIGKERIRRAGKKILEENKDKDLSSLDIGFRVLKTDSTNFKDVYYHPNNLNQNQLKMFETNIKEDRSDLDLLFSIMLDLGIELSLKINTKIVLNKKLYLVENNELIVCFQDNINLEIIQAIKEEKPLKVVLKDGCFANDTEKINAILELSLITSISVI